MKLISSLVVTLSIVTSFSASAKEIVCMDKDSKFNIESEKTIMGHEGVYEYNKMEDGEYASVAMMGCKLTTTKNNDIFDCEETTYGVYWNIYKAPKNVFASKKPFSVIEISREESGELTGTKYIYKNCKIVE
jgi:hypothetical protein